MFWYFYNIFRKNEKIKHKQIDRVIYRGD